MTVITVVAIAAVGAFFYAFIWPRVKSNITKSTDCANAVCDSCQTNGNNRVCNNCKNSEGENIGTCTYKETEN